MSGSETAATTLSFTDAIRSGILAGALRAVPELGLPLEIALELPGATAFGVGDGLAGNNLGAKLAGAMAAAVLTPIIVGFFCRRRLR